MRLVHVQFRLMVDLPASERISRMLLPHAIRHERVEHISVHPGSDRRLTVGFFVSAATPAEAEAVALAVVTRAIAAADGFRFAEVTGCSVAPLLDPRDVLRADRDDAGRSMRGPDPDTGPP
ncbi:hypothetical protein ACFXAS_36075 [Streptomyces sp. NPDC059459]|uniref:hypothetical protein n=1 Tax=Streptomyces sp. NPDC059459 TaxID=3346839 RepID=UPI00369423EC